MGLVKHITWNGEYFLINRFSAMETTTVELLYSTNSINTHPDNTKFRLNKLNRVAPTRGCTVFAGKV